MARIKHIKIGRTRLGFSKTLPNRRDLRFRIWRNFLYTRLISVCIWFENRTSKAYACSVWSSTRIRFLMRWNTIGLKTSVAGSLCSYSVYTRSAPGLHQSLQWVYTWVCKWVYTEFTQSLSIVYISIKECKPSVNWFFEPPTTIQTWNGHISANNHPFETNHMTCLMTGSKCQIVLFCKTYCSFALIHRMIENWSRTPFLAHHKPKYIGLISQAPLAQWSR